MFVCHCIPSLLPTLPSPFLPQQMADKAGDYMEQHKVKFIRHTVPVRVELLEETTPRRLKVEFKNLDTGEVGTEEYNTVGSPDVCLSVCLCVCPYQYKEAGSLIGYSLQQIMQGCHIQIVRSGEWTSCNER